MQNNKISIYQLCALIILEMIGAEAVILPKIGENLYSVIIMTIITALLLPLVLFLFRSFSYNKLTGGAGRFLQLLFSVKLIASTGLALYIFAYFIKSTILDGASLYAIGLITVLGAVYCSYCGIEAAGRAAEIILPFVLIPLVLSFCFGIWKIEPENFNTPYTDRDLWRGVLLSLNVTSLESIAIGKDFVSGKKYNAEISKAASIGLIYILGVTTTAFGVYGAIDYALQDFPTLEIIYTSGIFSFLQRQEELFVCIWLLGAMLYLSLHLFFSRSFIEKSVHMKKTLALWASSICVYSVLLVPNSINTALSWFSYVNVYGSILFLIAVPLFAGRMLK